MRSLVRIKSCDHSSKRALLKIMPKGFLYVADTLSASIKKFENINLSNLAFSIGFCETYSECALFASSKILCASKALSRRGGDNEHHADVFLLRTTLTCERGSFGWNRYLLVQRSNDETFFDISYTVRS